MLIAITLARVGDLSVTVERLAVIPHRFCEEPLRSRLVPAFRYEHVQHLTVLVNWAGTGTRRTPTGRVQTLELGGVSSPNS